VAPAQETRAVALWLLEPAGSPYAARIQQAANEAGVAVAWLDAIESAPVNAMLVGVGPSVSDPLRIARQLRVIGSQALLVFFTASLAARDSLKAELIRDPFLYPRFDMIDLPASGQQLAVRIGKVVSQLQRRLHMRRTTRRGRSRNRPVSTGSVGGAEPLLNHLLTQTRDAVVSTDEHGQTVTWNDAAARLFGLGEHAQDDELNELVQQVLASGASRQAHLATVSGTQLVATASPIRDPSGRLVGVSVIARDDSEYQRVQAALREANRQKDEFLAIMSHELRTPLTSILGYTDMVLRGLSGPLAPLTTKYVGNVRSAGDRLLDLVNSLLDYTRLEAGVERLDTKTIDLARVVTQAVHVCQSAADSKNVKLTVDVEGDASVEADEERITHVFRSMLGNALKFTSAGGWVRVRVSAETDEVRVSVSDSGIGMRPEQVGRVWERFYQGDASLTRPYGGMGLGLSIAQHLVSLHGGRVGAESAGPGHGSTFWFSVPRRQSR
jgi:signal transduction histidine kinase